MIIAVTGASGLIGTRFVADSERAGDTVVRLVRRPSHGPDEVSWDPSRNWVDVDSLAERRVEAIVHLAGAGIGDRRWTEAYKRQILSSRVEGTTTIAAAAAELPTQPALVSSSAIGFYGDTGDRIVSESSHPGSGFLADVVIQWEAATAAAESAGLRVVHARTGLVVSADGGAFAKLVPIFRAGLGGRIGSGDQWWSFISMTDEIGALRFLLTADVSGPVNLVAPEPVTNAEAIRTLASVLRRPAVLPVPGFALRAVVGEFAQDVLSGQRVRPERLTEAGFQWSHPDLESALRSELCRDRTARSAS